MKKLMSLLLILVLVFSLAACNKAEDASADEPKEETKQEEKKQEESKEEKKEEVKEKVLRAAVWWFPENLDPAQGWNSWFLTRAGLGETLATVNEKMEIVPQLADKWEKVNDTTWKFHIRQGVKFSNGKDLTPEAVKKSIERVITLQERAAVNAKMKSITVDGEYLIFETTEPYGSLVANLTEPLFSILDTDATDEEIANGPICTGPYKVQQFNSASDITLVKNENYWDGEVGLDKFMIKLIKDDDTRALALKSGEIDMAQALNGVSVNELSGNPDYVIHETDSLKLYYICLNYSNEFLQDLNVRKAIAYAINREAIAKITNTKATGAVFPEVAGYGYDQIDTQKYNLDMAKQLLKEAGYEDTDGDGIVEKDGKKASFKVYIVKQGDYTVISESIQAQLKEAGIEMVIEISENYWKQTETKDFGGLLLRYVSATTGDSQRFLEQNFSTEGGHNFGKYSNQEFDKLVAELASEFDLAKRKEITIKAEQILNEDVANIFIISTKNNSVCNKSVKNVTVFPLDYYFITKDTTIE